MGDHDAQTGYTRRMVTLLIDGLRYGASRAKDTPS
jgi:hypothetical protein